MNVIPASPGFRLTMQPGENGSALRRDEPIIAWAQDLLNPDLWHPVTVSRTGKAYTRTNAGAYVYEPTS